MKRLISYSALGLLALICLPTYAAPITQTIDLDQVYTGSTPTGPAPWLSATFAGETGSDTGTLTLNSLLDGTDFVQGGKNANATVGWAFYLDSTLSSLSCSGGTNCADSTFSGGEYNSGPVPGDFNLSFSWDPSDRFMGADQAIYTLNFDSALSASPFVLNDSDWTSVAHIQGIAPDGCSGWIVSGSGAVGDGGTPCGDVTPPPTSVAEPSSASLFALMVAGLGVLVAARRLRKEDS